MVKGEPCRGARRRALRAGGFEVALTEHVPGLRLARHEHAAACFHFVLGGLYQESSARGSESFGERSTLFKPAGEPHWNRFGERGSRTLRVEIPAETPHVDSLGPTSVRDPLLDALASRLDDETRRPDELTELAVEGLCLELVARLARIQVQERAELSRAAARDVVGQAMGILRARFRERLVFGELARELGVERTQLARAFRGRYRSTMGEVVRSLRVDYVRDGLRRGDRPLAELALAAGFADQSHCARVFKRLTGESPGRYRAGGSSKS